MNSHDDGIQHIAELIRDLDVRWGSNFEALQREVMALAEAQKTTDASINNLVPMLRSFQESDVARLSSPTPPSSNGPETASDLLTEFLVNYNSNGKIHCEIVVPGRVSPNRKEITFPPVESRLLRHILELRSVGADSMHWLWGYIFNPDWIQDAPKNPKESIRITCGKIRPAIKKLYHGLPDCVPAEIIGPFHDDDVTILMHENQLGDCPLKQLWKLSREAQNAFDKGEQDDTISRAQDILRIDPQNFIGHALLILSGQGKHRISLAGSIGTISPAQYVSQQLELFQKEWPIIVASIAQPLDLTKEFLGNSKEMQEAVTKLARRYEALHSLHEKCPMQVTKSPAAPYADAKTIEAKISQLYQLAMSDPAAEAKRRERIKEAKFFLCTTEAVEYNKGWSLPNEELHTVVLDTLYDFVLQQKTFQSRGQLAVSLKHTVYNILVIRYFQLTDEPHWTAASQAGDLRRMWAARGKLQSELNRVPTEDELIAYLASKLGWSENKSRRVLDLERRKFDSIEDLRERGIELSENLDDLSDNSGD